MRRNFGQLEIIKMEKEVENYINPFGTRTSIKKVVEENTRSAPQIVNLLANNVIEEENEFYVLFENGMLIEKGRSKVRTSEYLQGKSHINIEKYYEVL